MLKLGNDILQMPNEPWHLLKHQAEGSEDLMVQNGHTSANFQI